MSRRTLLKRVVAPVVEGIGWLRVVERSARLLATVLRLVLIVPTSAVRVWVEVGVPVARLLRLLARVLALLATAPRSVLLGVRDSWLSTSRARETAPRLLVMFCSAPSRA